MPNGITYVPNLANNAGARPIHTVNPDFNQLTQDRITIEQRIRDTFYNSLFTGISNLPTVRSASEIEARESEKLIMLGGVLERFESEALDPAIERIYNIVERAGLLPPPPPGLEGINLNVQYVSILSIAQRAVGTAPTERILGLVGNMAAVLPQALDIHDFDEMLINYSRDIGLRESEIKDRDTIMQERAAKQAEMQSAQMAEQIPGMAQAGKTLSETDVGGGANALEQLLGG